MATIATSRFALLKVDDELDSDDNSKGGKGNKANQQNNAAKKRNKKKKKVDQQKENEELRNLAFAKGGKPKSSSGGGVAAPEVLVRQRSSEERTTSDDKQWEEWQRVDKEFAADAYEQDLQQALMLSKLELEEQKKSAAAAAAGDEGSKSQGTKGKKKKKDKPATMSLGEFQSGAAEKPKPNENGQGDGADETHRKPTTSISEPDPTFFKKVEADTQKIIHKEHVQEEYRKQYIVENARTKHFQDELSKKDAEIERLTELNKKLEGDLKEVKERNQQLCLILAQGEMKGKTTVLLELDQLKQVRDELTAEVANLTSELEKERSKVHTLSKGSDKSKGGKHGK